MTVDTMNDVMTMRPGGGAALGRIDQYGLVRELGGGGFGTVYLARDTVAGIEVAVKGLPPIIKNNAEELERIRENFALVSRLHHPYIAAALHLQLARDVAYSSEDARQKLRVMPGDTLMVMEYAPGVTLTKWRKQFPAGKVPLEQAIRLAWQIAQALDYAHGQRIIHRDIKPSNIMVETRPDGEVVARLLDFGLAAEVRSSMGRVSREIHDTSGTRPYMAPEQWLAEKQGSATDQYALAVMFNELVTGEVPFASVFETGDPVMMMNIVGNKPFVADRELPKAVRLSLEKALAKKPEERFASCVEFVGALEGKGHIRKERKGVGKTIAVLVLLAALGGGAWWWQERRTPAPRDPQVPVASQAQVATAPSVPPAQPVADTPAGANGSEPVRRAEAEENRRKEKELADAKAAAEARRAAEAEAARVANEREEAERRRAADERRKAEERVAAERKENRRRQLYGDLAAAETALENFGQFEYKSAILSKLNSLAASYKAARTAFGSDDFESAFDMVQQFKKPCSELEQLLPTIKSYYLRKASAERARSGAVAVEAPQYAKKQYDEANEAYEKALRLADADDYSKAFAQMELVYEMFKAAEEAAVTNPESMYRRGLAAQKSKDNDTAFDMFSKASAKSHPSALVNLGLIHMKGIGVAKSDHEAFNCFRRAAVLNHARAQYLLGGCYAKAIGVKYDREQSRLWMIMAKVNGDRAAADFLSKAGWSVSADEEAAVREILETGNSDRAISAALRQIATKCRRDVYFTGNDK